MFLLLSVSIELFADVLCCRSIIGPALGGALAQPCTSYPNIFARGSLFDTYPFLLPNLVCVAILVCGVVVGILFLEETHEERKHRRDFGLEAGKWLMDQIKPKARPRPILVYDKAAEANQLESYSLLEEDCPPEYQTTENSPRQSSSLASNPIPETSSNVACKGQGCGAKQAFTKQVVLLIVNYGILA
jgi:hypothetical protein